MWESPDGLENLFSLSCDTPHFSVFFASVMYRNAKLFELAFIAIVLSLVPCEYLFMYRNHSTFSIWKTNFKGDLLLLFHLVLETKLANFSGSQKWKLFSQDNEVHRKSLHKHHGNVRKGWIIIHYTQLHTYNSQCYLHLCRETFTLLGRLNVNVHVALHGMKLTGLDR